MKGGAILHGAVVIFYSIIYLFSFIFKKEFSQANG